MTLPSILSTRLPYNELLSYLEEYVRMKEREAAERAWKSCERSVKENALQEYGDSLVRFFIMK